MAATAGVDLLRGRPTPAIGTTEAKLQQRKLDALKRGIHRIANAEALPYGIHLIGVGGAGARIVGQVLQDAPDTLLGVEGSRLSALVLDIDASALGAVRALAEKFPADRSHIETLALPMPPAAALFDSLQRYPDFLTLESPLYRWGGEHQPWLAPGMALPTAAAPMPRAVAKAIYGQAYYDGARPAAAALRRFAASVDATPADAVVCIVFGLGGGTGSGMAMDLARHLSNGILGRRVLVAGIAVAPCEGDAASHTGGALFPVLNELDCMGDEAKNRGVVQSCGDLYRNPFTAGFIVVPQQHVWESTGSLEATHQRVDREVAALLLQRRGANFWESLRLLNWVAAPSTQHSAARTPWGAKWIHMLGFADAAGAPIAVQPSLRRQFGLLPDYRPEFIELRVSDPADSQAVALAAKLDAVFAPDIPPRIAKTELAMFAQARAAYDAEPPQTRVMQHALLLDQGIALSEPSTRLQGMAGASLPGNAGWIAVSLSDLRGEAGNA
jgi:hypothetical protein